MPASARSRYGWVVLRRLSAIEHAVVAHHFEYTKVLGRRISKEFPPKGNACIRGRYINEVGEDAGSVDALERVAFPRRFNRQFVSPRFRSDGKSRRPPFRIVVRTQALRMPCRFSGPLLVENLRDADAIVVEDFLAACFLDRMVLRIDAPSDHRPFVLPYLIGQQQIFSGQALEPIDEKT